MEQDESVKRVLQNDNKEVPPRRFHYQDYPDVIMYIMYIRNALTFSERYLVTYENEQIGPVFLKANNNSHNCT